MKSLILFSTALCLVLNGQAVLAKNDRVTVCHNGKDKEVNENALNAHLGHGDILGTCGSIVQIQGGQVQSGQQTVTRQTVVTSSSSTGGGATAMQIQQQPILSLQQILDRLAQQNTVSVSQTTLPWQPVQGQTVYQYRYYPQAATYYDEGRGMYFYQQNGQWLQTKTLPSNTQSLLNTYVPLQMNTNMPHTFHPQVSQTYTTGSIGVGGQNMSQQVTTVTQKRTVTQTSSGMGQNQIQVPTTGVIQTTTGQAGQINVIPPTGVITVQQGGSQQVLTNQQQITQTGSSGGQAQLQIGQSAPAVATVQTTTVAQANQKGVAPANLGGGLQLLQTLQALQGFLQQTPAAASAQVTGTAVATTPQLKQDQLHYVLQTLQTIQQNPNAQTGMNAAQQQTLQNTLQQVIQSLQQRVVALPIAGQSKSSGTAVQTTTVTTETTSTTGSHSSTSGHTYVCHNGKKKKVNSSAINAHLAHGDTLGACERKRKYKKGNDKHQHKEKGKHKDHKGKK